MSDKMLTELYKRVFETNRLVETLTHGKKDENSDRQRGIAIAKNELLCELINIRTDQIRSGNE